MEKAITLQANLILDARATLGEGALWHPALQKLMWVDIEKCQLHAFDPATVKDVCWEMPARVSTVVPAGDGGFLVALQTGIHYFQPETKELKLLSNPITDPRIRFNDGKCDAEGRFWVGTIQMEGKANEAVLYRYDPDGTLHTLLQRVTNSNGLVWTPDGQTMYYIDTPTQTVQAFDFDGASGQLSHPRIAVRIPKESGSPDGMTIDVEGNIWVCLYGGGAVHCYDPRTGKLLRIVNVPAPHTTSCAFGGMDLQTLFITTAREKLSAAELEIFPQSGGLFAVKSPVAGVPANYFSGKA